MRPFCHLVFQAVRVDSPPLEFNGQPLRKLLLESHLQVRLSRKALGTKLGVSTETIKNWEAGRVTPNKKFWPAIRTLIRDVRVVPPPDATKGQAPRRSPVEIPLSMAILPQP
jgi:DNA-binding XRE family transcriptional regulator